MQGRMDEARQMLVKWGVLKPAARSMYKQMDNLLSKMPVYNVRLTYLHGLSHVIGSLYLLIYSPNIVFTKCCQVTSSESIYHGSHNTL